MHCDLEKWSRISHKSQHKNQARNQCNLAARHPCRRTLHLGLWRSPKFRRHHFTNSTSTSLFSPPSISLPTASLHPSSLLFLFHLSTYYKKKTPFFSSSAPPVLWFPLFPISPDPADRPVAFVPASVNPQVADGGLNGDDRALFIELSVSINIWPGKGPLPTVRTLLRTLLLRLPPLELLSLPPLLL